MMRKGFSPLRMFSRNSPYKKGTQENSEGGGGENQSALAPSCPPLYPIQTPCDPNKALDADIPSKQQQNRFGWSDNLPDPPDLAFSSDDTYSNPSCLSSEQRSAYATPFSASNDPDPGIPALDNNPSVNVARSLKYNQHSSALSSSLPLKSTVPQFELEEDPTFWKEHNVQVLLRMRPLNNAELSTQGHSRCIRQDSAHALTWIGHPETRFTYDFVASEATTQEKLFKIAGLPMVDNCLEGYNSCMFAYGQTGSGKTHTMLGDLEGTDCCISDNRGMTPRVFEYLFARIEQEEKLRRHENIKYACKCSFLEIYNEQITDLLEPSITNLQMREDAKKGVYVENLTEIEVKNVHDVIRGLLQGAANRRVAATNMNRESSRSHSVFTCVIESKWESDGVTSNRFGRLNLVDLAGSERQKSSGAEGERLKEAANINKSLSTLGLVIMSLVDIANGKQRHVPYRDSKLTFLLHDSLGGNSKTTIIANISPSKCCALETLSTLKFAQRAKFIRNNAVVNEDASGDVMALRMQIHQLKEEVNHLRNQSFANGGRLELAQGGYPNHDSGVLNSYLMSNMDHPYSLEAWDSLKALASPTFSSKKKKELEIALVGSLRREKISETMSSQTASEIEHLKRLVKQREEDSQCGKMMLRFREDKIKRLESMIGGFISAESYLLEENNALQEEVQVLRSRLERNPEVTRFAMENIRLMEQLRRFQDFYEGGEREALTEEIAILRDQLLEALDWKLMNEQDASLSSSQNGDISALMEENQLLQRQVEKSHREADALRHNLSSCLEMRENLERRVDELEAQKDGLNKGMMTEESSVHSQLEKQIETVEVVASMQAELMAMREAVAATTEAESEARGRMSALTTEIESLKMELQQLQGENSVLCSAFEKAVQEKESQICIAIERKDAEMKGLLQCLSETFCPDQQETPSSASLEVAREEALQSVKAHLCLLQEKEGGLLDRMQRILDGKIQGVEAAMERMNSFIEELDRVKMGFEEKFHGIGLTLLGHTQDCCIHLDECEKKVTEWICAAKSRLDKTEADITEINVGVASLQNESGEQGLELEAGNAIQALLSHLEDCCVRIEEEEDGMLQRLQGTRRHIENADALLEQTLTSASRIEDEGEKLEVEIMRIKADKAQFVDGEKQTMEKKEREGEGLEMTRLAKLFLGKLQEARSLEECLSDRRLKLAQSENKVRAIERLVEGLASARGGWKSREKKMHEYLDGLLSALESSRAGMSLLQEERRSLELSLELNARNEEGLLMEAAEIEAKLEIAAERRIKDTTQTLFVKQNDGDSKLPSSSMMELLRGEEERVALTSSLEGIRSQLAFLRSERDALINAAERNKSALLFAQVDLESATAEAKEAEVESEEIKKEEGLLLDTEAEANSQLQSLRQGLEKAKVELASTEETAESVDTEIKELKEVMLHLHEPTALCNSVRSL